MITTGVATDIRAEIERANEKFMQAFRRGDAKGLAMLYTQDGMVLPPNGDFVEGREQLESFWKAVMGMGIKSIELKIREIEQHADTAYEVSWATLLGENRQVLDESKYIVVWKKEDGEWKLHRDIFNSNLPK